VKEKEGEEESSESDVFYNVAPLTCRSFCGGSLEAIYYAAIFHHKIIAKLLENRAGFSYTRGGVWSTYITSY
jgi:cyclophilin family peptidyl-prolyl cis-trans isomerase